MNILTIMSDQHTASVMGCAGDPLVRTPNMDRLAEEGMLFSNAYTVSPICVPSRMSFMTGRTPSRNRVWENQGVLNSGTPTWAHSLGAEGYTTALIGRMHFLGTDHRHGFMERPIGEGSARFPGAPEQGGPRYTRFSNQSPGQCRETFENCGHGFSFYQYYDADVTDHALEFLKEQADFDKPFAAVVGWLLPHPPFIGPKKLFDYYYERVSTSVTEGDVPQSIQTMYARRRLDPPATEQQVRVMRAAYYAMIEYADLQLGRIMDVLDETGLSENTALVYTSDHGETMGNHGLWAKRNFYEQASRIPLIIRMPGSKHASTVCSDICSNIDLAPTFCEMAQTENMDMDGKSLMPQLSGRHDPGRVCFSEVAGIVNAREALWAGKMIRKGTYKFWVHVKTDGEEFPPVLFDLENDPEETRDLAGCPEYADTVKELKTLLYKDWDPDLVNTTVQHQLNDMWRLKAWGSTVLPKHPDTYTWPGEELEEDVVIISGGGND